MSDLVLTGDTVSAAVIDVGGFLGIGLHSVAVPIDALSVVRDTKYLAREFVAVRKYPHLRCGAA